ncbi:MAG TPA: hypothetical protein ENN34_12480 [Deltaproteobacteria bacterium]|nr:hypothetical protein [Deltaproteobacteria bacterium]
MSLPEPSQVFLLTQIVIQLVLIGIVAFLVITEKRHRFDPGVVDEIRGLVKEAQDAVETVHEKVQSEIKGAELLMKDLEQAINVAESLIKVMEEVTVKMRRAYQFSRDDIEKLHGAGYDALSIAQITGIPLGEVQLMIKIKNHIGPE